MRKTPGEDGRWVSGENSVFDSRFGRRAVLVLGCGLVFSALLLFGLRLGGVIGGRASTGARRVGKARGRARKQVVEVVQTGSPYRPDQVGLSRAE
jgi:hypothetical protein